MQTVSSGLQSLFLGSGAGAQAAADDTRARLGDAVRIMKAKDSHSGEVASVIQDDRDAQPYRLQFADGTLSDVFYRPHEVELAQRGTRPFRGDDVVITKANDKRKGEAAMVVQDDYDSQPYRLRYTDGTLSDVFYRVDQVALSDEVMRQRAAGTVAAKVGLLVGEGAEDAGGMGSGADHGGNSRSSYASASSTSTAAPTSSAVCNNGGGGRGGGRGSGGVGSFASAPDITAISPAAWLALELIRWAGTVAPKSLKNSVGEEMRRVEVLAPARNRKRRF